MRRRIDRPPSEAAADRKRRAETGVGTSGSSLRALRGHAITEFTTLLDRCRAGDAASLDRLFSELYAELRDIAVGKLARTHGNETVTPTVLVHEVYLRLTSGASLDLESRRHFYTSAARAMQHYLVDRARRRHAAKRGGAQHRVTWTERLIADRSFDDEVLDLSHALDDLGGLDPRGRQVVELRFFAGLPAPEIAELLELSERTVHRAWRKSRAFLHARLASAT